MMDRYIRLRKIQTLCETYVKYTFLNQILQYLTKNYEEASFIYEKKQKSKLMYIKITFLWIRRCKRWGDGAETRSRRKIKNCITVGTNGMMF